MRNVIGIVATLLLSNSVACAMETQVTSVFKSELTISGQQLKLPGEMWRLQSPSTTFRRGRHCRNIDMPARGTAMSFRENYGYQIVRLAKLRILKPVISSLSLSVNGIGE